MTNPTRVLLVEGADDLHVTTSLLARHQIPETFAVEEKGGIDRILELFPVQLKATGIERVGVTIDADVNLLNRWNSVRVLLETAGYQNLPQLPAEQGTIIDQVGKPRVGIWIMPNNIVSGMIEDFATFLIPATDNLREYAQNAIHNIPRESRRFTEAHTSKAVIHTWLAWQSDPGTPMGLAITKKYLDANCVEAKNYIRWLESMFVL